MRHTWLLLDIGPKRARQKLAPASQKGGSMSESRIWGGTVRRLSPQEIDKFREHLLRLDHENRRMRFGVAVSDPFVESYAPQVRECLVYGFFAGGEMHAAAEMRTIGERWPADAEAAFSVEHDYQNRGIGTELFGRIVRSARNRGISRLYMDCLAENYKMQRLCRKFGGDLHFDHGEVVGRVLPGALTYISLWEEAVEDSHSFAMAMMSQRPGKIFH